MEPIHQWVRRVYDVREPSRQHPYMVVASHKRDGHEVGRWMEGRRIPLDLWLDYLEETPEVKAVVEKEHRHRLKHESLHIALR